MKQPKPRPQHRVRVTGVKRNEPKVELFTQALIELAREQADKGQKDKL